MSARHRVNISGHGSFFPSGLDKNTYKRIEEDVVVAVNLLHMAWRESNGKKGLNPNLNYNCVYDKKFGKVFVEFWPGAKSVAKAYNMVERFTVAEVCSNAMENTGGEFERFKRKEVII